PRVQDMTADGLAHTAAHVEYGPATGHERQKPVQPRAFQERATPFPAIRRRVALVQTYDCFAAHTCLRRSRCAYVYAAANRPDESYWRRLPRGRTAVREAPRRQGRTGRRSGGSAGADDEPASRELRRRSWWSRGHGRRARWR